MHKLLYTGAVLAATIAGATAGEVCPPGTTTLEQGNYYCGSCGIQKIVYEGVNFKGTCNRVTSIDATQRLCKSEKQDYNGPLCNEVG
jgi:hypothetical protein